MASGRFHSNVVRHIDASHEYEYGYHPSIPTTVLEIETVARGVSIQNQNRNHVVPLMEGDEGVFLTWEDLWVTVQGRSCRSILQGITGYAKPGQLLAIMGPSGCGKSTFLDALAGN
ncbi:hypothetical protein M0R45_000659 [Rubus argutus]|uniref:ABC transporter domain-containing protein n=1 Tax=Rubus argutus TaxID=59490 RepID=A0AAW1VK94_RUBAR